MAIIVMMMSPKTGTVRITLGLRDEGPSKSSSPIMKSNSHSMQTNTSHNGGIKIHTKGTRPRQVVLITGVIDCHSVGNLGLVVGHRFVAAAAELPQRVNRLQESSST